MTAVAEPATSGAQGGFIALMRHRNYALLWTGQLISHLGDRFHWVAISLWVYAQTGSALSVSFAIMALMVAPAVVGLLAGALVDRLDRRKIMVVADLVRAGLVAAIPTLMDLGLPWVYATLFLVSAASAFFRPAMFAAIPQSVPKERLLQANAFFASLESAVEVVGPALAGLLVMKFRYAAAMYVDALSYVVSAWFVYGLRLPALAAGAGPPDKGPPARPGILQAVREGLLYVRGDQVHVALLAFLFSAQWVVGLSSLQTPLAKGVLGITDRQFGWFQSVWGLGFVGASLLLGWFGKAIPRGQAIVFGYLLWALAAGAMGESTSYPMLLVTGFWVGFANILVFVNVGTVIMEHTPPDKVGRAIAVRQIAVSTIRVAALLLFGALADATTVRTSVFAMAAVSLAGTIGAGVRFPALLRYSATRTTVPTAPLIPFTKQVAEPVLSQVIVRISGARADPDFSSHEQRWLNASALAIVVVGWLLVLLDLPMQALGGAGVAAGTMVVVNVVRRGRRAALRQEKGGGAE